MPDLFPNTTVFLLCALVVALAQLIYATVGFGAGMFSISLLALILPDLSEAVATLLILGLVTEAWVLSHAWRQARIRLLLGLLPTTAIGLYVGTSLLAAGGASGLKRALGVVVVSAGVWFLYQERTANRQTANETPNRQTISKKKMQWIGLPTGLLAGGLAGLFGTGGPPVIFLLKTYRLDKSAFRATILWYFLLIGILRGTGYVRADLLTRNELIAAVWLLPAAVLGTIAGMVVHRRLSEHHFGTAVSLLLTCLGIVLVVTGGK